MQRPLNFLLIIFLLAGVGGVASGEPPKVAGAPAARAPTSFATRPPVGSRARCPVAGEEFVIKKDTAFVAHDGRFYALCCADCKPDFEKNPARYADKK